MDFVEITMDLEDRFGITLEPSDWERAGVPFDRDHTVDALCHVVIHKIRLARPGFLMDDLSATSAQPSQPSESHAPQPAKLSVSEVRLIVKQVIGKILNLPVAKITDDMLLIKDLGLN